MQKFLREQKSYPPEALAAKVEGTVSIRYTINHLGDVIHTKVVAGIGYGCDEESQRIVALLKFSVPKNRKVRAQYHKTTHIHFRLPKQSVRLPIQYNISVTQKESVQKAPSYFYQVNW